MEAPQQSEESVIPFELSLRVRHPAIDPGEISAALGLEAEHCFRAGDPRTGDKRGRRTSHHTQTYWLAPVNVQSWADPIEPAFIAAIAARRNEGDPGQTERNTGVSQQELRAAARNMSLRSVDALLFGCLRHLNTRHAFLERIQREGGDVSLLIAVARESPGGFALPAAMMRILVKLGVSLEFNFDA